MTHSIFIKTYERDLEWCKLCVMTIQKFAKGFKEIVIAGPVGYANSFPSSGVYCPTNDKGNGYIYQQYVKMQADSMCQGDVIHYVDSDCHFTRDFTPEDFMRDGKPILYVTPFSQVGTANVWKACTEKALGWECYFETMRRLPWLAPRSLLPDFRAFIAMKHGVEFRNWVLAHDGSANNSISEFNAMGNFALRMCPDDFYVLDTTLEPLPHNPCIQKRSWDGLTMEMRQEIEGYLI